ncbi:unnamed protein product [Caenorhabditis angaria]|uniref:Uncharacterized protein n=1 Tax=Caenorhabditis angaria TaxID=860376 RepID=A0A9P1MVK7_9PELO|nr:unnamed protein product [Caenorhabditis angaria]
MSNAGRRFSTVTQINTDGLQAMAKGTGKMETVGEDGESRSRKFTTSLGHLALYKEDEGTGAPASFISGYTTPGPKERATSEHKKANLGIMLGVYLPTIQHILGVTMFIRLFWVVGMAGVGMTMVLLAICCLSTLLTSISLSAVATNGVVESGGAYFIISRNLGVEFGSAVGILFYLANTVAASMYIVGGVEVLLMYIYPEMAIGGSEALHDTELFGTLYNNLRLYGTIFLIIQALIVAMGVKFVQLLAPVSLMCVILAVFACIAGGVEKGLTGSGTYVCSIDDHLIQTHVLREESHKNLTNGTVMDICSLCDKSSSIEKVFCGDLNDEKRTTEDEQFCTHFTSKKMTCDMGFPGFNMKTLTDNMWEEYMEKNQVVPNVIGKASAEVVQDESSHFFLLMAIYFPAVTGIFTGTNMSGDLADPQRSIPIGTIAATLTTSAIYYILALLFGGSIDRSILRDKFGRSIDNTMVVAALSWPHPSIVTVGAFLSTFGAALQCLCSAPRLLQSIAKDDVIPILAPFARVTKKNEPFLGLILTVIIAEMGILLGAVDKIAEVLDFFFLMCYAFVNMIAFLHSILKAPNWRPRFKYFHWSLSLLGAVLCFFIMFASDIPKACIACILTAVIYKYVEWKGAKKEWGDGMRGLALSTAQYSLLKVEDKDPHPKNWRPQILICLTSQWSKELIDRRAISMLNLGAQLKAGRGLAIACAFLKGSADSQKDKDHAKRIKQGLLKDMATIRLRGFAKTMFYNNHQINGTISGLYQSIGIGGLKPNTVLLNWPNDKSTDEIMLFAEEIIHGAANDNCLIVTKGITDFPEHSERLTGFIDIWWIVQDGGILMLIAYLLKQHKVWKGCSLRIFAVSEQDSAKSADMKAGLQKYIYMLRIDAELFIVDLLDMEVSDEVVDKTVEVEKKQKEREELRRSKSGYLNDGYMDDMGRPKTAASIRNSDSTRSFTPTPAHVSINLDENETSFTDNILDEFYRSGTPTEDVESATKLNIHKMNTSVRLNRVIRENSPDSQLILLNLPSPPRNRVSFNNSYMTYLDVLTEELPRVLFIGGSGREVITIDS